MIKHKTFDQIGLPTPMKWHDLVFHDRTQTLVVHTGVEDKFTGGQLYFRLAHEERYQPIGNFPANTTISSFCMDAVRSLFFMTYEWQETGKGGQSGNSHELFRFDLEEHRVECLGDIHELPPPPGIDRAFVRCLLGVGDDGRYLTCVAGLEKPEPAWNGSRVDYWVCRLSLADFTLTLMSELAVITA
jgi:hypothetical protein